MNRDSHKLTNLLLFAVVALLLVNLAIPVARNDSPASVAPSKPVAPARDAQISDLVAKVDLLLKTRATPPPVQTEPVSSDEIVVRIPGKLARDLGITASDVRIVVEGLARVAKQAGTTRMRSYETAAIATARNCSSAQAQFQATAKADADRDGTGEFGSFREMSGGGAIRGSQQAGKMNPPVLSGAFRKPGRAGYITRSGYNFLIYLPDAAGDGVAVDAAGYDRVDANLAETHWCMYAWPAERGSATRTFMVCQTGDVIATDAKEYVGDHMPLPGAAFADGGRYSITGQTAIGTTGQDGHVWKQVN